MSKLLTITKDVAMALVRNRLVRAEDLPHLLHNTYNTLARLTQRSPAPVEIPKPPPAATWKESIRETYIACLECGKRQHQITVKHLRTHLMTSFMYRKKWGIPPDQPLCSHATRRRRRETILQSQPWEARRRER